MEIEDEINLIPNESFYVVGRRKKNSNRHTILSFVKTRNGWKQRVVDMDHDDDKELNVDYISNETRHNIQEWMVCDFRTRFRMFDSFEEAEEYREERMR